MTQFILNDQNIATDLPPGITVLDFVRYGQNLRGTKIGCREGDCGACTILVGELKNGSVAYRTMTSCLMPLANAAGKHIVTIEGINPEDGSLTPVQQALVEESGTQCGFCTVGFVMSLTGFCIESVNGPHITNGSAAKMAISSVDGNICRCTGYKSIERAAARISEQVGTGGQQFVPDYFAGIGDRLSKIGDATTQAETRPVGSVSLVGGGTDVYVQNPEYMAETQSRALFYDDALRGICETGEYIEVGASVTVTDLLESPVMQAIFPNLYKHLKLVSSTPIRNMATLAGNFVNASPIGDMTIWFLALDAEITLGTQAPSPASAQGGETTRTIPLRHLYLGYKHLAKSDDEYITSIRFRKPTGDFRFNFEKVSKRTYLDISTVNTAISIKLADSGPEVPAILQSEIPNLKSQIEFAHVSAGGVAPVPLYLKETSAFLRGKEVTQETIGGANEIIQSEISPISDVRGSAEYKRLLLTQLFKAHFYELFEK